MRFVGINIILILVLTLLQISFTNAGPDDQHLLSRRSRCTTTITRLSTTIKMTLFTALGLPTLGVRAQVIPVTESHRDLWKASNANPNRFLEQVLYEAIDRDGKVVMTTKNSGSTSSAKADPWRIEYLISQDPTNIKQIRVTHTHPRQFLSLSKASQGGLAFQFGIAPVFSPGDRRCLIWFAQYLAQHHPGLDFSFQLVFFSGGEIKAKEYFLSSSHLSALPTQKLDRASVVVTTGIQLPED